MPSPPKICVVGAGTVGLSCALRIKQEYGSAVDVTIVADKFIEETTSCGSGGLWEPYQIAGTPDEKVNYWGKIAFDHFLSLYHGPDGAEAGVQLMTAYQLLQEHEAGASLPSWRDIVFNFTELSPAELKKMNIPVKFVRGFSFGTLVIEQKRYMAYLTRCLRRMGVRFVVKRLIHLDNLFRSDVGADVHTSAMSGVGGGASAGGSIDEEGLEHSFDIVVNCSGLGAFDLIQDKSMYPIRGQVIRVKAPWIKNVWFFGTSYIIPNVDTVVLGGTAQKGDWSTEASQRDTDKILRDVYSLFPSLQDAPIAKVWAGLRPGRTPLRLESERSGNGRGLGLVVHCYGHGGSGITLAMGCAEDVVINHIAPFLQHEQQQQQSSRSTPSKQGAGAQLHSIWIRHRSRL